MARIVTTQTQRLVKGANPGGILIVIFLIIALFVFLGGGKKKGFSDGGSGNRRGGRQSRGGDEESDIDSARPDGGRSRRGDEKDPKDRERERRKRKEAEEKQKQQQQAPPPQPQPQPAKEPVVQRFEAPDLGPPGADPLSDKKWQRDPNKRPERPSGRSPPILLKRGENNEWIRPPLSGKKGVSFADGGVQGREASNYVSYNQEDPSNTIYDQTHTDLFKNHVSAERGRDGENPTAGKLDGSESPLKELVKTGKLSQKLMTLMKRVEWACMIDHLDLLNQIPQNVLQEANDIITKETFIPKIGNIPTAILDIIQQMLIDKAIDLPLVMSAQAYPNPELMTPGVKWDPDPGVQPLDPPGVMNNFINRHLLSHGFAQEYIIPAIQFDSWGKLKQDQIQGIVHKWTESKLNETPNGAENQFDVFRLLLAYFVPYYRCTTSYKEKAFKGSSKVPGFDEKVGQVNALLVKWFRYIGKPFLVSRMFSPIGAEVGIELSLKLQISKRAKQVGFIMDYTLFVPNNNIMQERNQAILARNIGLGADTALKLKGLSLDWVYHLNDRVYPQPNGNSLFSDLYPFQITRLTFRPGPYRLGELDYSIVKQNLANPNYNNTNGREITLMNVSTSEIEKLYDSQKKSGEIPDSFARLYRTMGCQMIRYINKRQFQWYNPSSTTDLTKDKFDEESFQYLLMLSGIAIDKLTYEEYYKNKNFGRKMTEWGSVRDVDYGDTVQYSRIQAIDFGGIIPIEKKETQSGPQKFLILDSYKGLKWILLPVLLSNNSIGNGIIDSAGLIVNQNLGLSNRLYGHEPISITFHGKTIEERNQFIHELRVSLSKQSQNWLNEYKNQNGATQDQVKGNLIENINKTKEMIKKQIKFVIITSNDNGQNHQDISTENNDNIANLTDFEIPSEMLPQALR